jgi:hypothetical protein
MLAAELKVAIVEQIQHEIGAPPVRSHARSVRRGADGRVTRAFAT